MGDKSFVTVILWRRLRPGDDELLRKVQEGQSAITGEGAPYVSAHDPGVALVRVAERNGKVVGAMIVVHAIELRMVAADNGVIASLMHNADWWVSALREVGVTEVYVWGMEPATKLGRLLARVGFCRSNPSYVPFWRKI